MGLGRRARKLLTPGAGYEQALTERRRRVLERMTAPGGARTALGRGRRWWWVAAGVAAVLLVVVLATVPRAPRRRQPAPPERQVAQVPADSGREVTQVNLVYDGVQIVWVFDSQFEP